MIKENVLSTKYLSDLNTYGTEPYHSFIYKEIEDEYFGFHCYFCDKPSNMTYGFKDTVILDEYNSSSGTKFLNEEFISDVIKYIQNHNTIYNTKYNKIAILNNSFNLNGKKIISNDLEFFIYEI